MKRPVLVGAIALVVSLSGMASAAAGGSWLDPRDVVGVGGGTDTWNAWAAPGAIVTLAGDFCDGQGAPAASQPWTTYLRSSGSRNERIEVAPTVISTAAGNGCLHLATTTFAVPDVAPGVYWVDGGADRSSSTFPGDLMGGMLTVAATSLEAELLRDRDEQAATIVGLRRDRTHLRTDVARLEEAVDDLRARHRATAVEFEHLTDAEAASAGVLAQRDAELAAVTAQMERWRGIALGLGVVVALLLAGATWFAVHRRRKRRVSVPDSPAELFEDLEVR